MGTTTTVTLHGTPAELGEQMATSLLEKPLHFACEQLSAAELEIFCCSYLAATAGLMARKIGRERMATMVATLIDVVSADAQNHREPMQ